MRAKRKDEAWLEVMERRHFNEPWDFFHIRWICRYIVQSIQQCGDMSMAYELMLKDKKRREKKIGDAE